MNNMFNNNMYNSGNNINCPCLIDNIECNMIKYIINTRTISYGCVRCKFLRISCEEGSIRVLNFFPHYYTKKYKISCIMGAIDKEKLNVIKWFEQKEYNDPNVMALIAAKYNRINILEYIMNKYTINLKNIYECACKHNNEDIITNLKNNLKSISIIDPYEWNNYIEKILLINELYIYLGIPNDIRSIIIKNYFNKLIPELKNKIISFYH